jgi:hypothetical protein
VELLGRDDYTEEVTVRAKIVSEIPNPGPSNSLSMTNLSQ